MQLQDRVVVCDVCPYEHDDISLFRRNDKTEVNREAMQKKESGIFIQIRTDLRFVDRPMKVIGEGEADDICHPGSLGRSACG